MTLYTSVAQYCCTSTGHRLAQEVGDNSLTGGVYVYTCWYVQVGTVPVLVYCTGYFIIPDPEGYEYDRLGATGGTTRVVLLVLYYPAGSVLLA